MFLLVSSFPVSALDPAGILTLEIGYRHDEYESDFKPVVSPTGNNFIVKDLNLFTVGVKGRLFLTHFESCGDFPIDNFYLTGFANWGWAGKDPFKNTLTLGQDVPEFQTLGQLDYGHTSDYQVGLGYLFRLGELCSPDCLCEWDSWAIGFSGGYAWDKQNIKTRYGNLTPPFGSTTPPIPNPLFTGLKYHQKWQGPWVGTELFYELCQWTFNLGYEFHFCVHTESKFSRENPEFLPTDGPRTSKKGYGNIVFFNGNYKFCNGIEAGLHLKYQGWNSTKLSFQEFPGADARNSWYGTSVALNLGYAY